MSTRGQIKLLEHFKGLGKRQKVFAENIGTTPATVSRWLTGKAKPNDRMKIKLERQTKGAVEARDWLVPADEAAA